MVYLDYAAATPVDEVVAKAMEPYLSGVFYNPSATYKAAIKANKDLQASRAKVAFWLGAKPSEVTFTAGGTEANNLAIRGVMEQYPKSNLLVSGIEHESVLEPARLYAHKEIKVLADGRLDLKDLESKIDDSTVLISIMYANNEIGTIQPVREIAALVATVRKSRLAKGNKVPLLFHSDACQAANYLDLHTARLGVDLMTLNGGKIYGPKQSGALYIKGGVVLKPQILGGGQERGLRSGTENVGNFVGFAEALELAQETRTTEGKRLSELQTGFIKLIKTRLADAEINGSLKNRLPNNIHITLPGQDNERLLILLDEGGVMAAAGSACSASDEEASHVLKALGFSDRQAQSSLRFTMGRQTTSEDIEVAVKLLATSVL